MVPVMWVVLANPVRLVRIPFCSPLAKAARNMASCIRDIVYTVHTSQGEVLSFDSQRTHHVYMRCALVFILEICLS